MRRSVTSVLLFLSGATAFGQTTRVSVDSGGAQGNGYSDECAISEDATFVVFASDATNLVAGDTNGVRDVFAYCRITGITTCVSVDSSGVLGNKKSFDPSVSADGRYVCFSSDATNLVANDTNAMTDVFVHDCVTGTTERISVDFFGNDANGASDDARISADGNFVAFRSAASDLVVGISGVTQVYRRDRVNLTTLAVSVDPTGAQGNAWSQYPSISADGSAVAFASAASNLVAGDVNGQIDVFVRDFTTFTTELASVDGSGAQANDGSAIDGWIAVSDDGNVVAFPSYASNLVAGDSPGTGDIFVRNRTLGTTICASLDPGGAFTGSWNQYSAISGDGRFVTFQSWAKTLVSGDLNGYPDIFVRDLLTSTTWLVSVDSGYAQADRESRYPSISQDGSVIAFVSYATNLVPGDTNFAPDVFTHEMAAANWSLYGTGFPGLFGVPSFSLSALPVIDTAIDVEIGNSAGMPTVGVVFAGASPADILLGSGAHLLVAPVIIFPIIVDGVGSSIPFSIPDDMSLCGLSYYLQVGEVDLGAIGAKSFTQGLEMDIGI